MPAKIFHELYGGLDEGSGARYEYTRRAFGMLRGLDKPRLLDVGCGRGGVALALARLTGGEVIGVDVDTESLETLRTRAQQEGLGRRVQAVPGSMRALTFEPDSFDVIWSEGSIHVMGVAAALTAWRKFVRPGGYVGFHEMTWRKNGAPPEIVAYWREVFGGIGTAAEYAEAARKSDYDVLGQFLLPEDFWQKEYYGPLAQRIKNIKSKYADRTPAKKLLLNAQKEVELYQKYNQWYGSSFMILQKRQNNG